MASSPSRPLQMDNHLMSNDNNNINNTLSLTGTKNPKDPPRNAVEIKNTSTDAKNTDSNSTSTSSDNNINKIDVTEKATNLRTDIETTIKDDNKKQTGGTESPTTQERNNRMENTPNDMGSNTATTVVQCTQEWRKGGAYKGNINNSHFMWFQ